MNNTSIKKIVNFLQTHPTLESVNREILLAEIEAKNEIERVKLIADESDVVYSINESQTISRFIGRNLGIDYMTPSYVPEFKSYTCRVTAWFLLWYSVRDSISDLFSYVGAEVNESKGTVKMTAPKFDSDFETITVKQFGNGKAIYTLTPELAERIELVNWVYNFFEAGNKR